VTSPENTLGTWTVVGTPGHSSSGRSRTPAAASKVSAPAGNEPRRWNRDSLASVTSVARREELWLDELGEPISHYTHAVRFGDFLFISGCGPFDSQRQIVGGDDAAAQAEQVLLNIGAVLEAAGMEFADILKVTVYLTDINDRPKINPVRQRFFGSARPASTLVEVSKLAIPGMKVEIEAVAARSRA